MNVAPSLQGVSNLHSSSRMQMGFGSHSSDNDPDILHKEKEKNLSGAFSCLLCIARSALSSCPRLCKSKELPGTAHAPQNGFPGTLEL